MKRATRPGFAGIENELPLDFTTTLHFSGAKDSLVKLLKSVEAL